MYRSMAVAAVMCCALALGVAVDATAPPAFSFYDFLLGEWEVVRGSARVDAGEQQLDTVVRGTYMYV